ncbi:hypothetical protein [Lelliottia nimipressuralis]|uniref:Injection protein n=1 Tax=Lelliottia nimipressuralis TaxID=69220 RepID=A0ABD4KFE9_9ENTR|nr:hypothetical protein [Lelliottia nimipressuralis]MBF4180591.1 hypothetical protein [Lelliottia nimipressuralis]
MSFSTVLPNGYQMTDIPDGTSWVEIANDAIKHGHAMPQDFQAYPDIYSQLAPPHTEQQKISAPHARGVLAQQNAGNVERLTDDARSLQQSDPIAAASMGQSAMLAANAQSIDEHPQAAALAVGLALAPVTAGLSLPTAYVADAGSSLALDSAEHVAETGGTDAFPEHPLLDVTLPVPGLAHAVAAPVKKVAGLVAGAATPIGKAVWDGVSELGEDIGVNSLLRRFSPRTAATVKGMADGGALDSSAERVVDEPPAAATVAEGEQFSPEDYKTRVKTVAQGADRAQAEQALYDQKFMEHATRLHSAVEGTSYAGGALKSGSTRAEGQSSKDALTFYRAAIAPYESSVIPRDELLAKRLDLIDAPYFEILARTDSAEIDNLITKIDAGGEVDPAHFLDALEAYRVNQEAQINAYAKRLPQHYASDLRELARQVPDVNKFLSDAARMGVEPAKVAPKVAKDYQQGFTAAISEHANGVEKSLRAEADSITEQMAKIQREQKNNPRLKAVLTAMSHSHDTLEKMADNIQYGLEKGTMKGGVSPEEVGMLRSMAHTHDAAAHIEGLYLKYRAIESGFAALPGARTAMENAPLTERLLNAGETALTIKTLGANRALKAAVPSAIAGPALRVRKAIETRRALKEVNKLVEDSKK